MSIAPPKTSATLHAPPVSYSDSSAQGEQPVSNPSPQHPSSFSAQDYATVLPPPSSNAWQPSVAAAVPRSPSPPAAQDDFALSLPPPDSAAWQTLAMPTTTPERTPSKENRKKKSSTRRTGVLG